MPFLAEPPFRLVDLWLWIGRSSRRFDRRRHTCVFVAVGILDDYCVLVQPNRTGRMKPLIMASLLASTIIGAELRAQQGPPTAADSAAIRKAAVPRGGLVADLAIVSDTAWVFGSVKREIGRWLRSRIPSVRRYESRALASEGGNSSPAVKEAEDLSLLRQAGHRRTIDPQVGIRALGVKISDRMA